MVFFSFLSDTDLFLQSYFVITHLNVGARTFETVPVVSGVVRKWDFSVHAQVALMSRALNTHRSWPSPGQWFHHSFGFGIVAPVCVCVCVCERERERESLEIWILTSVSSISNADNNQERVTFKNELLFCISLIHQGDCSSYSCCVTNHPIIQWHKTAILLCSWSLGFRNSNRAQQGQIFSVPWCLGPQLMRFEGWKWLYCFGLESFGVFFIHIPVVDEGYCLRPHLGCWL